MLGVSAFSINYDDFVLCYVDETSRNTTTPAEACVDDGHDDLTVCDKDGCRSYEL